MIKDFKITIHLAYPKTHLQLLDKYFVSTQTLPETSINFELSNKKRTGECILIKNAKDPPRSIFYYWYINLLCINSVVLTKVLNFQGIK
jgi:hypothetical protein